MSKTLLHVLAMLAMLNMASMVSAQGMQPVSIDGGAGAAAPGQPAADDSEGAPSDDIDAPPPTPKPVAPAPEPPPPPKKETRLPALALPPIGARISRPDAKFLNASAENQIAGMYDAQLASDKASSASLKNLSLRIYDDRTEINNQIQQISAAYGLRVATDPSLSSKMWFKRLSRMEGEKFDSAYIDSTLDDLRDAIDSYQKETATGGDDALRRFASNVLKLLQDDLKLVQSVHDGSPYPPAAAPATPPAAGAAPADPAPATTTPAAPAALPADGAPAQPATP